MSKIYQVINLVFLQPLAMASIIFSMIFLIVSSCLGSFISLFTFAILLVCSWAFYDFFHKEQVLWEIKK